MSYRDSINSVAILGAGHCGRQIAYMMARVGVQVCCLEPDSGKICDSQSLFEAKFGAGFPIKWTSQPESLGSIDLLLESVPESLPIKRDALKNLMPYCPDDAILASNSSYLAPSMIFRGFPAPERFASLHFHVPPWFASAVDVMPSSRTAPDVLERLSKLVERMELTPIVLKREFPGYVFNNLLHPLLVRSLELVERGVCKPEDVERSWRAVTHMPVGPFGMMLEIGLPTLRQIMENAVAHLGDQSTIRAHRFLENWDGNLDTAECARINAPKLPASTTRDDGTFDPRSEMIENRFTRYQLVWQPSNTRLQPCLDIASIVDRVERLSLSNESAILSLEIEGMDVFVVSDIKSSNVAMSKTLHLRDLSDELQTCINAMKSLQLNAPQDAARRSLFLLSFVDSNEIKPSLLGLPGILRSIWLEKMARAETEQTYQAESHLAQSHHQSDEAVQVHYLEVDLQSLWSLRSATDLHSCDANQGESKPERQKPLLIKHMADNAVDVKEPSLADRLLHVHQRYQRCGWQVPKLQRLPDAEDTDQSSLKTLSELVNGTRWIVSGDGRGITFRIAKHLGQHGAQLELFGRTPIPQVAWYEKSNDEIQEIRRDILRAGASRKSSLPELAASFDSEVELSRNLHTLKQMALDYRYHVVDVTSQSSVRRMVVELESCGGPIHGILHGAGFEQTTLLAKKTDVSIRKTLESKVRGALNLESVVSSSTRWFIQMGSLAGYFGGVGQVDYAAANGLIGERTELLKAKWPNIHCLTIAWPGWEGVGMAARTSSKRALQMANYSSMSLEEGVRHFHYLMERQVSDYILIGDPEEIPTPFFANEQRTYV